MNKSPAEISYCAEKNAVINHLHPAGMMPVNRRNAAKTAVLNENQTIWHNICIFLLIIRGHCTHGVRVATLN